MLRFLKNFLLFAILCFFQVFSQGNFFIKPVIDLLLIFLILTFFDFPFIYLVVLLLIRGIIFDSLSGLLWGINLLSLGFTFGIGFLLTRLLERENFISKIIIGEIMMASYWLVLFVFNLMMAHQNLGLMVIVDFLINSLIYLGFIFLNHYVFPKKIHYQR